MRYFPKVKDPDKFTGVQGISTICSEDLQKNISKGEGEEKNKLLGKQEGQNETVPNNVKTTIAKREVL